MARISQFYLGFQEIRDLFAEDLRDELGETFPDMDRDLKFRLEHVVDRPDGDIGFTRERLQPRPVPIEDED